MKYDVTFTEQAEKDLRSIFEYIAFDLLSPENAAGQLDRIEEKILSLGEYPEKFRQYERGPVRVRDCTCNCCRSSLQIFMIVLPELPLQLFAQSFIQNKKPCRNDNFFLHGCIYHK